MGIIVSILELISLGICAGCLGALVGLGGGVIIVPVLTLLFKLPIHEAVATSLIAVMGTSISGASSYLKQGLTSVRIGMFLETATTLGALIGALIALRIPAYILYIFFSILAFYTSITQVASLKKKARRKQRANIKEIPKTSKILGLVGEYFDEAEKRSIKYVAIRPWLGWLISFIAGLGSGMLGVGGGFIKVSAMNVFMNMPIKASVATSKFMIAITASTAATVYLLKGLVNLKIAPIIALGTALGAKIGAHIMNKIKSKIIKILFSAVTFYIGYSMLRKGLLTAGIWC